MYYICTIEYYILYFAINIYLILDFVNTYEIIKYERQPHYSLIKIFINYFYMS